MVIRMLNNEKIGIGIITYNRQKKFYRLYNSVKNINYVDHIIIIKNKDIDYHQYDPNIIKDKKTEYINIREDVGVGACKNKAINYLLEQSCDHIFIIEDDIIIKKEEVFKQYIDIGKIFNLGHLNFNGCWDSITKKWLEPFTNLIFKDNIGISLFARLCGSFEYFTKQALIDVGLFDQINFHNALQHVDHTYRMSLKGYTTPFHVYVDILNSNEYLQDDGIDSSINLLTNHDNDIKQGFINFKNKFGYNINQIKPPTKEQLITFIKKGLNHEI